MSLPIDTIYIPDNELSEGDLFRRVNRKEPVVLSGSGQFPDSLRTEEGRFSRKYEPRVFYIYDVDGPMASMWPVEGYTARYEVIARTLGEAVLTLWKMGKDLRYLNLSQTMTLIDNGKWIAETCYEWSGLGVLWDNIPKIDGETGLNFTGCNFTNQRDSGFMGGVIVNNMNFSHCILNRFDFMVSGNNYNLDNAMGYNIHFYDSKMTNTSQNGTVFVNPAFYGFHPHKFDIKSYKTKDYNDKDNAWVPHKPKTKEDLKRYHEQLFY